MSSITFRLKQFLEERHEFRHGTINELAKALDIPRQQIAALLNNKVKYVSLETLTRICDYLARTYQIDQTQLPAMLFALEPSEFWSTLAANRFIEICFGVRHDSRGHELISASDCLLQGVVLRELFGVGRERYSEQSANFLEQQLVPAYERSTRGSEASKMAQQAYDAFHRRGHERTLICLGSIKSNVVIEKVMANAFGAEPFVSQDTVATPNQRRCPIFFRVREHDPHPISCYAGEKLAQSVDDCQPGIYYETASGEWDCCPCTETEDAALVLFVQHRGSGVLEVVMGGFSGRATRALADKLSQFSEKLWPPSYERNDMRIGAFIIRFAAAADEADPKQAVSKGRKQKSSSNQVRQVPRLAFKDVIPLAETVIARRLDGDRHQKAAKASS